MIRQASGARGGLAWALGVAALVALTLFVFTDLRRYNLAASPFDYDPGFGRLGAAGGWEVEGDPAGVSVERGGILRLRNTAPGAGVAVRRVWPLPPPGGPRAFRVAATLAVAADARAEVAFVADGDIGRADLETVDQLAVLRGDRAAARYVARFEFPQAAREVALVIRLSGGAGELHLRGLEIKALEERTLVAAGRVFLQAGWAMALALGCWLFWRGVDEPRAGAALAAASGAGLFLLLLPRTGRDAVIDPLTALLPEGLRDGEAVGDLGHLAIFAAAGLLVRLSRRRERAWRQLLLLVALAGVSELLQFLTELRSPDWGDWARNGLGALAGWSPAALWLRFQEGQFAPQGSSSTTLPPQAAKQRR